MFSRLWNKNEGGSAGNETNAVKNEPSTAARNQRTRPSRPAKAERDPARETARDTAQAPQAASSQGAELREAVARGDARGPRGREAGAQSVSGTGGPGGGPGRSHKKPRFSAEPPSHNGSGPGQQTYRPQGSLVPEPVPSADNLPPPEKLFGRKRNFAAAAFYYVMLLGAACFFLLLLFLPLRYWLSGGSSAADENASANQSAALAAEQAKAIAVPFTAAYLHVAPNDGPQGAQARVSPFVAQGFDLDKLTSRPEGAASTEVLSSDAYRTQRLGDDRWAVFTESVISTTTPEDSASGDTPADPSSLADQPALGSSFTAASGDATTTVKRVGLEVFVGQDDSGAISVVAPPSVIAPRSAFEGKPGALVGEKPQSLSDGPVKSLLEGYLAASYGQEASRASINNFLVPGAKPPAEPAPNLEFMGLGDGTVYEVTPARGSDLTQVYDVEAYVNVRDPEAATTSTQTHVLRVGETSDGWKIVGGLDTVAR